MSSHPAALIFISHYPQRLFTYVIPNTLRQKIRAGNMVRVSFGSNVHVGLIAEIIETTETAHLKEIEAIVDTSFALSPSMLSLARWMASYYLSPVGECLQLMLPPMFRHGIKERFIITPLGRMMAEGSGAGRVIQHAILIRLQSAKHGLSSQYLRQQLGRRSIASTLRTLKKNGHIESYVDLPSRTQYAKRSNGSRIKPNPAYAVDETRHGLLQDSSLSSPLASSIRKGRSQIFIMQAPLEYRVGAYLKAIQETITKRRSCIVIFPHTSQAREFSRAVRPYLGDHISDWFGTRTLFKRTSEWYRLQSGDADIVIGTRSSALNPMIKLGLIIVDEEHDFRHKFNYEPRFHTREIALARASREMVTVILGSSHPSVEAIHLTQSKKAMLLFKHSATDLDRVSSLTPNGVVQCIDMRTESRAGRLFSEPLLHAMRDRLTNRKPVILYQPRRGFSRSLWCRDCGATIRCTSCSVALTYYKQEHKILCHICGESRDVPHICSRCAGTHLLAMGFGTEGVEAEVRTLFPDARIVRMDRDLVRSESAALSFMKSLDFKELDILIGTSMLLDIVPMPKVSLVGVISADTMLHMPDFRAAEHAFHQLMALKSFLACGEMLIQAFQPEHPMLQSVARQDLQQFYTDELAMRQELSFPPFTRLVCLRVAGDAEAQVRQISARWANHLRQSHAAGIQEVLGPVPAPYSKIRGRYRDHILVKEPHSGLASELAHGAVEASLRHAKTFLGTSGLTFEVDVDPHTFL
ncbi:MAG: primosomal protein N' [Nitrospiraceae bacterium]|nr:primosomal protein N' [Nitrospiraceae bacterium]